MKGNTLLLLGAGALALWWLSKRRGVTKTAYAAPGNIVTPSTTPPVGTQPVYTPQVAQQILTAFRTMRPDGYITTDQAQVYVDALSSSQGITTSEMRAQEAVAMGAIAGGPYPTGPTALPNGAIGLTPTQIASAPSYFDPGYTYAQGPSQQELQALGVS